MEHLWAVHSLCIERTPRKTQGGKKQASMVRGSPRQQSSGESLVTQATALGCLNLSQEQPCIPQGKELRLCILKEDVKAD